MTQNFIIPYHLKFMVRKIDHSVKGRHAIAAVLFFIWLGVSSAFAQTQAPIKVTGNVVDGKTGEAIIGAIVQEKGNPTNGTTSDVDGNFSIEVPATGILIVQYLGYAKQEIPVNHSSELSIHLNVDEKTLNEVVVIGYGAQRVKDLTAPISVIQGRDLSRQLAANPMSALQGKVAGVQIINSGAPGAGPTVRIRGVGSIGDYANPLYVVDGVFVENIDFLNSSDIETMSVLKDASAAAIYGVRAANGVVLITTRKGSQGKPSIVYDGYVGVQTPVNIMPLTNKDQYIELLNEANQNIPGYVPKDPNNYPTSTDWYQVLVRNALIHSHSLDVSGATEQTNYSLGMNYFYQDGIVDTKNSFDRLNFRGRIDQTATNWLKIGLTTLVSNYTQYTLSSDMINSIFGQAFVNPPVYPVYDDNNTAAYPVKFGSPQSYGFSNSYGNPVATAYYNNPREKGIRTVFSTYAEISFIPDKLKWKTAYNLNYNQWNSQVYQPENFVGGSQGLTQSQLSKTFGMQSKSIVDNTLTYNDAIDRHHFSVMLGQSTRIEKRSTMTGTAVNVPGFDNQSIYLSNGSSQNQTVKDDDSYRYNGLSFFTRGTYNYADRYLATLTFRADGSSKYNQHWGYFPSIGLGWVLTGEDFMKDQHWTDYLKLRASWGLLGNDNVPSNSSYILGTIGAGSSGVFGNRLVDGVGAQTVFRNFLKWEVVNEMNIGVDSRFLRSRLSAELDYYNRTTSNVVFSAPIATGGGATELLANNGTVRNQGVELTLGWNDRVNEDFSYNIGLNATTINNKVLALNGRDTPIPGALVRGNFTTRTQIGSPIGSFWGYEIVGVFASEGDALRDPVSQPIKDAGYFKYKDQNGDNVIDEKDKVYLGSPIPKLIAGMDFGGTYRKVDFSLNIQTQIGNKMLNAKRMNRDVFADGNYDLDFYNNVWRPDRLSNTYPSAEAYNSSFIQQANSFFVEDASYIRIQNIQVGYTFDKLFGMQQLRVYVSAQRPLTFFTYKGFTPEVSGSPIESGIDRSVYPMQAVYAFGLKANF